MIVGSGIVGTFLGSKISDCQVWEKRGEIAEKACSGLVSRSGLKSLGFGYDEVVVNQVRGARFISPRAEFEVRARETKAVVYDRHALQKIVARDCENAGSQILFNKPWNGEQDDFVIGADGALSGVAKHCGVRDRKFFFTYQEKVVMENAIDPEMVELYFSEEFAPGMFAWLIPYDEHRAELGLGCAQDKGNAGLFYKKFAAQFKIKEVKQVQSALIPVFDPRQRTVFGNKALVGDAAGQVKATTGGGIVFGWKCAEILADCVKKGKLEDYERAWRKRYERDLKMHLLVRRFLDRVNYDKLLSLASENNLGALVEQHGDMDHPKTLLKQMVKKPGLWLAGLKMPLLLKN